MGQLIKAHPQCSCFLLTRKNLDGAIGQLHGRNRKSQAGCIYAKLTDNGCITRISVEPDETFMQPLEVTQLNKLPTGFSRNTFDRKPQKKKTLQLECE